MKKIILTLVLLMLPSIAEANKALTVENAFLLSKKNGPVALKTELGDAIQKGTVQVAQGVYDFTKQGAGHNYDIDLGAAIPANATVKNSYYKILKALSTAGTASATRFSVGMSTVNQSDIVNPTLLTAQPPVGVVKQGALWGDLGGASTFLPVGASTGKLKMRVTGSTLTQGKVVFFVEYVVSEQPEP